MTKQPSLETALSELQTLVEKMEGGNLSLEESLKLFEQGVGLTKTCHKLLKEAEQKVKILTDQSTLTGYDGEPEA